MKFCLLFNLSPCAGYCLLIGSQLTTWSQGNLHYIGLHFFQLDREFFCLLPSLTRLYSAAASPSERLRSDGSLAINSVYLFFYLFTYFNYRYKRQYLFRIESDTCSQSSLYVVDPYIRSIKSYLSLNVIDHHWKAPCCLQERLQLSRCIH